MKRILTLSLLLLATVTFGQWSEQVSGTSHELISSSFVDANTGWMIGFNGTDEIMIKTTDGGVTWTPTAFTTSNYCTSVFFIDANHGWVTDFRGNLYQTTDGGSNWTAQILASSKYLHEVMFVDANTGYVVGESGLAFKSTDGGTSWNPLTTGTTERLTHVYFTDAQNGWAGGWAGVMIHTTDGGTTWTSQATGTAYDICGITFVDATTGWASATNFNGADGVVLHTTDKGDTWTTQYNPTNYLNEIQFLNQYLGYMVGWGGVIYNTCDGGTTWVTQASGVTSTLYTLTFTDISNGWAAGTDGVVLHTGNGGFPVGISEQGGQAQALSCSPNPVSGSTLLSGTITEDGNVKISILDITGQTVAVVTDGYRPAGTLQVRWNTGSLAPGLYFGKMESAGKTSMIRMIVR